MEIIDQNRVTTKKYSYHGGGTEFALIYFKNLILTLITFGLYYPWAKVEKLNYHYQSTELGNSRFAFHATGREVFRGFIKIYLMIIVLYAFLLYALQTEDQVLTIIGIVVFYLFFILIIPLAIHGAIRYRSSRSSWKGIHFKYTGNRKEFFLLYLKGLFLTIITIGIYGSWFQVEMRKYIMSHFKLGNLKFGFKGDGATLFWINLKFILLVYLTLGIYTFWYYKNLYQFYADNTTITQDGKTVNFKFNVQTGDIFALLVVNFLLIVFTLGLATPWVIVRIMSFLFRHLEIEGDMDFDAIQQANFDDYGDASGDDFLDFFDFDLI